MTGLALLLSLGLVCYAGFLVASTLLILQYPPRRTYAWAVARRLPGDPGELAPPLEFRRFEFSSAGKRLAAWDIQGLDSGGPLVVLTHGWSDSKVGALSRVSALAPLCSRLIAWDLPGHGESGGACELGLSEADDLLRLVDSLEVGSDKVLMGWSLGAGVSLAAAAKMRVAGVIAEAPYRMPETPAMHVMRARGSPWRVNLPSALWLIGLRKGRPKSAWRGFDRAEVARGVSCPVLVLRGSEDAICPREDASEIVRVAPDAKLVEVAGGRHNDLWTNPACRGIAAAAAGDFLSRVIQSAGSGVSV
ncbi:MAG: alpha/beta hydrolase [Phycisphaeraceae bacterium]|nr:alpha/beta hydrolase [Phycisphaeraceae bacterium]